MGSELGRIVSQKGVWTILSYDRDRVVIDGQFGEHSIPWGRHALQTSLIMTDDDGLLALCAEHGVDTEAFQSKLEAPKANSSPMLPLSFSSISTFDTCPRQFHHLYVLTDVKSKDNEANLWGTKCHKEIEDYLKEGREIDDEAPKRALPLIQTIRKLQGAEQVEWKWALNTDWSATGFFDAPMLRGVIDWLVVTGEKAIVADWKFGRRKENSDQLKLFALAVFLHHPEVQKVRTMYVWLKEGQGAPTVADYTRDQVYELKAYWGAKTQPIGERLELGVFPPKRSGLCRGWCPVTSCEHCEERR